MLFQQLFDAESSTYTYLLADAYTREAIIIDPVLDQVERDSRLIDEYELSLRFVLDTHVHADHITAAESLRARFNAKTGVSRLAAVTCNDLELKEGDVIEFGSQRLRVLETPGHTNCSLCFVMDDRVFTGDTLLIRGCGRTDFQDGSAAELYRNVREKLFTLPSGTLVYPGHDYRGLTSSTIGIENRLNPRLKDGMSLEAFVGIMDNLGLSAPKKIQEALPANLQCGKRVEP